MTPMTPMKTSVGLRAACALLALFVAGGCAKKEDGAKKSATQAAAKVNSDEITVHQVNAVLSRTPNQPAETAPRAKREILTRLVDQQLAVQQALKTKLDRTPGVVQALEAARAEVLARAYTEQIVRFQPKPTAEEVKKYYAEHPELFAQRRLYSLEEIAVAGDKELADELRAQAAKLRNMKDIATWLQARKIGFTPSVGARAAEQLPMEMLSNLQAMKEADIAVFPAAGGLNVVRIAAARSAPGTEQAATPASQQDLFNRRATEAVANELKSLKSAAKIEYMGEFAADLAEAEAQAKAQAEAAAEARAAAKAKAEAEAQARAEEGTKSRKAAEERSRLEAPSSAKSAPSKVAPLPQQAVERAIKGL